MNDKELRIYMKYATKFYIQRSSYIKIINETTEIANHYYKSDIYHYFKKAYALNSMNDFS